MADQPVDLAEVRRKRELDNPFSRLVFFSIPADYVPPPRPPVTAPDWTVRVFDQQGMEAYFLHCENGKDDVRMGMIPAPHEREIVISALCEALMSFGYKVERKP